MFDDEILQYICEVHLQNPLALFEWMQHHVNCQCVCKCEVNAILEYNSLINWDTWHHWPIICQETY